MKKIIGISVVVLVVVGVIALLMYNKKQNESKQKQNVIISAFPVKTTAVKKQIMEENLSMVGTTYANIETPINSETQGRIVSVKINFESVVRFDSLKFISSKDTIFAFSFPT